MNLLSFLSVFSISIASNCNYAYVDSAKVLWMNVLYVGCDNINLILFFDCTVPNNCLSLIASASRIWLHTLLLNDDK